MTKLKTKKPLLAYILRLKFPMALNDNVVIAWGDTIYAKQKPSPDLMKHEQVHLKQQKFSKLYGLWWCVKYCFSTKFRLSQEIEGYQRQYQYFCRKNKNQLERSNFLIARATELSGELYGNIVSFDEAIGLIKLDN